MDDETFKKIIKKGFEAIPKEYVEKLDNVAIVAQDEPTLDQIKKIKLRKNHILYGLYEGIPLTKRNSAYSGVLPDKITIFKNAILSSAKSEEDIEEMVKNTVWHEIAHHFGMDEVQVRKAEHERKNRIKNTL